VGFVEEMLTADSTERSERLGIVKSFAGFGRVEMEVPAMRGGSFYLSVAGGGEGPGLEKSIKPTPHPSWKEQEHNYIQARQGCERAGWGSG
jgi:hypothetical protein